MHEIIQAIVLGVIQGLTEFIPVSSSGHLVIGEKLFGPGFASLTFDVILHFGTLVALLVYFRKDIIRISRSLKRRQESGRQLLYLAVATAPAAVAGFFLVDIVETALRSLWIVVAMLVAVALLMFVADRRSGTRTLADMNLKDSFIIGLAQAVSIIPGTSRAGSTLVAGSILNYNNAEAARFSFYMAIPIIFGANLRVFFREGVAATVLSGWPVYLLGAVVSGVVGYIVIGWLLKYLSRHKLAVFAWYRIGLAVVLTVAMVV